MIVVTGACGFIGSRIVKGLFDAGCNEKVVLVDYITDENVKKISKYQIYDFMTPSQFMSSCKNVVSEASCVFHQGAITDTTHPHVHELMKLNYNYTKRLLSNCVLNKTRLVYASSAAIYGEGKNGFKEVPECEAPLNVYGFTKLLLDNWARQNNFFSNYNIFGLRYFNVYGMGEEHKENMSSPILKFFKDSKKSSSNSEIKIFEGSENFYRDFVAVEDVVKVNLQCAFDEIKPGIYNVGSGKKVSFLKIAETVVEFSEKETKIRKIKFPDNLKGRYQANTHANLVKLRKAGYKETMIDPEVGIKKYLLDLDLARKNEDSIY